MDNPADPGYVDELLQGEAFSTANTPEAIIAHGLDPRIPGNKDVSVCGAPWVPASSIGGQPLLCAECVRIVVEAGIAEIAR